MITEGLLMYLPSAAVEALAAEAARHGIRRWLLDTSSLDLAGVMGLDAARSIENVRAADHLQGAALLDAVRSNGWRELRFRSYSRDAAEVATERIAAMIRPYVETRDSSASSAGGGFERRVPVRTGIVNKACRSRPLALLQHAR